MGQFNFDARIRRLLTILVSAAIGAGTSSIDSVDIAPTAFALTLLGVLFLFLPRRAVATSRDAMFARFVSPNVAQLVDVCAGQSARCDAETEISIVCVDVREFTRFSAARSSAEAMQFLREYYDAVGAVVTRFGGTVKDYAGDGILVLMGAPQPMADHAERALAMATAMRDAAAAVTARWSDDALTLGVGIGVASGPVTTGLVGGVERIEYAAVGPAVNLAARLCSAARSGEVLVDARSRELAAMHGEPAAPQRARALTLKGIARPVIGYVA